jgi:hypothetical protein
VLEGFVRSTSLAATAATGTPAAAALLFIVSFGIDECLLWLLAGAGAELFAAEGMCDCWSAGEEVKEDDESLKS